MFKKNKRTKNITVKINLKARYCYEKTVIKN